MSQRREHKKRKLIKLNNPRLLIEEEIGLKLKEFQKLWIEREMKGEINYNGWRRR